MNDATGSTIKRTTAVNNQVPRERSLKITTKKQEKHELVAERLTFGSRQKRYKDYSLQLTTHARSGNILIRKTI